MARHRVTVVVGCEVRLAAHGMEWSLPWDVVEAEEGQPDCPKCGHVLTTDDVVNVGVCLGEHAG